MAETYFDLLGLRASLIDDFRGGDTSSFVDLIVELPSGSVDLSQLTKDIEFISRFDLEKPAEAEHVLSGRTTHVSWGADTTQLEFIIEISKALGYPALYDGLKHFILKYRKGRAVDDRSYTDEEFTACGARLLARLHSDFRYNQFKATGIERDQDPLTAKVFYLRNETEKFDITIRMVAGVPVGERHYRDLT